MWIYNDLLNASLIATMGEIGDEQRKQCTAQAEGYYSKQIPFEVFEDVKPVVLKSSAVTSAGYRFFIGSKQVVFFKALLTYFKNVETKKQVYQKIFNCYIFVPFCRCFVLSCFDHEYRMLCLRLREIFVQSPCVVRSSRISVNYVRFQISIFFFLDFII